MLVILLYSSLIAISLRTIILISFQKKRHWQSSNKSDSVYRNSKRFIAVLSLKCMHREDWAQSIAGEQISKESLEYQQRYRLFFWVRKLENFLLSRRRKASSDFDLTSLIMEGKKFLT